MPALSINDRPLAVQSGKRHLATLLCAGIILAASSALSAAEPSDLPGLFFVPEPEIPTGLSRG